MAAKWERPGPDGPGGRWTVGREGMRRYFSSTAEPNESARPPDGAGIVAAGNQTAAGNTRMSDAFHDALGRFADSLTAKFGTMTAGEPEDQLKAPVETLLKEFAELRSLGSCVVKGEASIKGIGRPDMAIERNRQLIGHLELKAPGKGADAPRFKSHDHDGRQWHRFRDLPNLIYTDGRSWALYRLGERERPIVHCSGDPSQDGARGIEAGDADRLLDLLTDFFSWNPVAIVPAKPDQLAPFLAPYARLLRDAVADALGGADGNEIAGIRDGLKKLLFPEATDGQFADAYAQTILFGLLLARAQGADVLDLNQAYDAIASEHTLLDDILQGLTNLNARRELGPALDVAQRMVAAIPPGLLASTDNGADPWLFFYEDFLAAYDPRLRKEAGAYYTPVQVVRCQVRLADEILHRELKRGSGFLDAGVSILDPAVGTGTYPLAIIDQVARSAGEMGAGAVPLAVGSLVQRLFGFELMVGPYAVAQMRLAQSVRTHGAGLPADGIHIYLTNTLEDPHAPPPDMPLWGINRQIADEHRRALAVKDGRRILVILGNPPYGRHDRATKDNRAVTGAWVRWGKGVGRTLLDDFLEPAKKAGFGRHLKNIYNHYVYFIRWAVWKAFEHGEAKTGPGIVSFITASSYLDGDAFAGIREHLRRECDEIRILDLGGEGRGTHRDENVFDIQTPVAIFVAWRRNRPDRDAEATVRYARIEGTRDEKFRWLEAVRSLDGIPWQDAPTGWLAPFRPASTGTFAAWPLLADIMPWQNNGMKAGRTWVIAPAPDLLDRRLGKLLAAGELDKARQLFKDSPTGRKYGDTPRQLPPIGGGLVSLAKVEDVDELPKARIGYRSFDRQHVLADARMLDRAAPPLWSAHSERQMYFASLFTVPLGPGPALTVSAHIPDLHVFCNRGAKDVLPLYRDSSCLHPNLLPGLVDRLGSAFGATPAPEDVAAYLYGALAHPAYQERHAEALRAKEVRVPLTKDGALFARAARIGRRLLWLHTYGERFGADFGALPSGQAQCRKAPGGTGGNYPDSFAYDGEAREIRIGDDPDAGRFGPVAPEVWDFEVSGFKVVQSWLGYRMRNRKGRKSSPLDDIGPTAWTWEFTVEFLHLLSVLEHTLAGYPEQARLLEEIEAGPLFTADELPPVPKGSRRPLAETPLFGDSF